MATSYWRPLYTLSGAPFLTKEYTPDSALTCARWEPVAWASDGEIAVLSADNQDVLGLALEACTSGATGGPNSGKILVHPFNYDTVYAVKETADLTGAPVTTDIGNSRDLELDATNGWGIHASSAATAATPNFRVIDIDTVRGEWHVVISPLDVADVFQWVDAIV